MIYTACNRPEDTNSLYQEWTGTIPKWSSYQMSNAFLVVAKDDSRIVGAARVIVIQDPIWNRNWGLVENVYVLKEYRRKGVGKGLMKFIETQFLQNGLCKFIKLTSQKDEGK